MAMRCFGLVMIPMLVVLAASCVDACAATREFKPGSLTAIKQEHQGQPFLLKMWSVDCPPCVKDLGMLRDKLKRHRKLNLVLVSVDESSTDQQVAATLHRLGMDHVESWIFAHGDARSLRREIDSQWYGELPRTYFYDAAHARLALTGPLTDAQVDAWLQVIGR
ncbi:TlpA family protein disulfide reductase [Methylolobus aquaticus]